MVGFYLTGSVGKPWGPCVGTGLGQVPEVARLTWVLPQQPAVLPTVAPCRSACQWRRKPAGEDRIT